MSGFGAGRAAAGLKPCKETGEVPNSCWDGLVGKGLG